MFLRTLASKVQSAEARRMVPDMEEYLPPKPGEVVIGTVTDSDLIALLVVYDAETAEVEIEWPTPPVGVPAMKAALTAKTNLETLKGIVDAEIHRAFEMGPTDEYVLRQGYGGLLVMTPAPPDVQDGLTKFATTAVQVVRRANDARADALLGMLGMVLPDCGNPDCPVHGYTTRAQRERQSLQIMELSTAT